MVISEKIKKLITKVNTLVLKKFKGCWHRASNLALSQQQDCANNLALSQQHKRYKRYENLFLAKQGNLNSLESLENLEKLHTTGPPKLQEISKRDSFTRQIKTTRMFLFLVFLVQYRSYVLAAIAKAIEYSNQKKIKSNFVSLFIYLLPFLFTFPVVSFSQPKVNKKIGVGGRFGNYLSLPPFLNYEVSNLISNRECKSSLQATNTRLVIKKIDLVQL